MKSRKLMIVSGLAAVALAAVGVALALTAPANSKDGVDSTTGSQGQVSRSLGL
jgi:hypothetical protein